MCAIGLACTIVVSVFSEPVFMVIFISSISSFTSLAPDLIVGSKMILNPKALGYTTTAFIGIFLDSASMYKTAINYWLQADLRLSVKIMANLGVCQLISFARVGTISINQLVM